MKIKFSLSALLLFTLLSVVPSFAQMGTVKGMAKDTDGSPIAGGTVDMVSHENGRKISLKTQKNGEFMSIGVPPGVYHVYLSKDGKQLWDCDNFQVSLSAPNGENLLDLDLQKKQQQAATGNAKGMTEEQKKQMQEAIAKNESAKKENLKIGDLNKMLNDAKAAHDANNDAQAVAVMQQAAQAGPNYDQVWGVMGQYQIYAKQYDEAATAEKKAVEIANASTDPKAKARTAQWQNLLGQAYSRTKGRLRRRQTRQTQACTTSTWERYSPTPAKSMTPIQPSIKPLPLIQIARMPITRKQSTSCRRLLRILRASSRRRRGRQRTSTSISNCNRKDLRLNKLSRCWLRSARRYRPASARRRRSSAQEVLNRAAVNGRLLFLP